MLHDRYEIREVLGRGGLTTTYLAVDHQTQQPCAIKCLSFRKIAEWKSWELFEREANILKNLNHPQIPAYIDFFTEESEHDTLLYLVQAYVSGKSLGQLIQERVHFTENQVIRLAIKLARVLEYLHRFSPPIIHRDIKPENIILAENGMPFLIDFNSVRDTVIRDMTAFTGAPTIVGTYGYMPIEQTEGRAVPASDIYALGMTLVALLSLKDPAQFDKDGLRLDIRSHLDISKQLLAILERAIAPDCRKRYQQASEFRQDLERLLIAKSQERPAYAPLLMAVAVVLLLIVGGFSLLLFKRSSPIREPQQIKTPATPLPTIASRTPTMSAPRPTPTARLAPTPTPTMTPTATPSPIPTATPTATPTPYPPVKPSNGVLTINIYQDFKFVPEGSPLSIAPSHTIVSALSRYPEKERLKREPIYRSSHVWYGYLRLGNTDDPFITFALDDIDQPHWVAYVDRNNNEDLTDDGIPYKDRNAVSSVRFGADVSLEIDLLMPDGKRLKQPYRLTMWVIDHRQTTNRLDVYCYALCHYAGTVLLAGDTYQAVAFEKLEHNGLLKESGIGIDLNSDGQVNEEEEIFQDGMMIPVKNQSYRLRLVYP
ncbi:serine/threonine protein kinase [Candidatus Moduliflexus flocculans]|uniref:non-specific serine/threonine protein kinase n=1 Tax=Candidatus Moduliflexus flocculans TaxID=1499966 RepID=A0A081BTL1_9BACT|nr:serine/threonine protein kinase [Candidatus Moduliflexus flocculans]